MSRSRPRSATSICGSAAPRRRQGEDGEAEAPENGELALLTPERFAELEAKEQLLLTITVNGFGKRTLGLRVPGHQPGRAGDHQHRDLGPERPGRRHLPGGRGRPDHAGHRPGPDDPHPGARHPRSPAGTRRASSCSTTGPTSTSSRRRGSAEVESDGEARTRTARRSRAAATCPLSPAARRPRAAAAGASATQARGPGDEPDTHRDLPGHVRPDPQRATST